MKIIELAGGFVGTVATFAVVFAAWRLSARFSRNATERALISSLLASSLILVAVVGAGVGGVLGQVALVVCAGIFAVAGAKLGAAEPFVLEPRTADSLLSRACLGLTAGLIGMDAVFVLPSPPVNWDAMTYHLYFPARWLQESGLFHIPTPWSDQSSAFAPQNGALFFTWWMGLTGRDAVCNWIQIVFLATVGLALFWAVTRLGARGEIAVLTGCLPFWMAPFRDAAYSANVDMMMVAFWWLGLVFLVDGLTPDRRSRLWLAGLAFGLAVGTKTIGLPLVGLTGLFAAVGLVLGRRTSALLPLGLGCLISGGGWYAVNLLRYGNPLFPLAIELPGITLPGIYGREALGDAFHLSADDWLSGLLSSFGWPTCLVMAIGLIGLLWGAAAAVRPVGGGLLSVFGRRRFLLLISSVVAPVWVWACFAVIPHNSQTRFLLPTLLLSCLGVAALLRSLPERASRIAGPTLLALLFLGARPDLQWRQSLDLLAPRIGTLALLGLCLLLVIAALWARSWAVASRLGVVVAAAALAVGAAGSIAESTRGPFLAHADFYRWGPGYLPLLESDLGPRRIAYSGANIPYALTGNGRRHLVRYVNVGAPADTSFYELWRRSPTSSSVATSPYPGYFREQANFSTWKTNLDVLAIDTVVVFDILPFHLTPADGPLPIEQRWMRERPESFRPILRTQAAEIWIVLR